MEVIVVTQAHATERGQLNMVNDRIHDRWFDVSGVKFDESRGVLRVPFDESRSPTKHGPGVRLATRCLEIGNVERYTLKESEGVGRYDFNVLRYAPESRTITVTTGIPLTFEVLVRSLDVRVRDAAE